ncbi:Hypothetical_protein [Hexamita inflata]|uniref:Hypothetical_protein n=1 Tax=Hexamita inflata TaxID=28002 RepID=A0AA86PTX7_9EUKA|nr:Hypothetical protein HINF_LOCUS32548 [Hexamita inflata]
MSLYFIFTLHILNICLLKSLLCQTVQFKHKEKSCEMLFSVKGTLVFTCSLPEIIAQLFKHIIILKAIPTIIIQKRIQVSDYIMFTKNVEFEKLLVQKVQHVYTFIQFLVTSIHKDECATAEQNNRVIIQIRKLDKLKLGIYFIQRITVKEKDLITKLKIVIKAKFKIIIKYFIIYSFQRFISELKKLS